MKPKCSDHRRTVTKVAGRGIAMNAATRVVPHKDKDRRRPKTRELLRLAGDHES